MRRLWMCRHLARTSRSPWPVAARPPAGRSGREGASCCLEPPQAPSDRASPGRLRSSPGVLQARGDTLERQQEQAALTRIRIGAVVAGTEGTQGPELKQGQRVDVRVAQLDGAAEHPVALEEDLMAGDGQHPPG